MKKPILSIFLLLFFAVSSFSQKIDTTSSEQFNKLKEVLEKDKQIPYQTGSVDLNSEIKLSIPKGYKLMPQKDAEYVVYDLWGNPRQEGLMGMLVKDDYSIVNPAAWAFIITYEKSGYVKDEDADEIDYDEMMKEMHSSEADENEARAKQGYSTVHVIGWAAKPYYDKKNNILHWAKSLAFGGSADTTLNYDVRILGRKGVLSLNAVGTIDQLKDITEHVSDIIHIAKFKDGSKYTDFNPDIDQVAAYSIGGLVAGKLLAKAGILALLLKNIKLIALGLIAVFGKFGRKIIGFFSRDKTDEPQAETDTASENAVS
ncbi:DUF2167 domain-containing protein [Larkinella rosea]|uniref:DUF2167 domain-containing protein n=1 Tax=Larkinella rosea TaxID=2025312 RepID=A0A3P1C174_9BACT|nr:DUF2167 domain-containing protein [Larkinella rosea]RRB06886.1 DUF2167 domain-containing protein [Larkinella rosea]